MINIYRLLDPDTGQVCYVGQTIKPIEFRLYQHIITSSREHSKKAQWLQEIISAGKWPTIQLVEECQDEEADGREQYWIDHYLKINPALTNSIINSRVKQRAIERRIDRELTFTRDEQRRAFSFQNLALNLIELGKAVERVR